MPLENIEKLSFADIFKIGVLKNFALFTGKKPVLESLFNKVADLKACNFIKNRSSHRSCSLTKGVLRNFAKFIGKHMCQSLFFNKVAGLSLCLSRRCSIKKLFLKFCNIHRKTPALESLFNKVTLY